jgi:hypothetical protein
LQGPAGSWQGLEGSLKIFEDFDEDPERSSSRSNKDPYADL